MEEKGERMGGEGMSHSYLSVHSDQSIHRHLLFLLSLFGANE